MSTIIDLGLADENEDLKEILYVPRSEKMELNTFA